MFPVYDEMIHRVYLRKYLIYTNNNNVMNTRKYDDVQINMKIQKYDVGFCRSFPPQDRMRPVEIR